MTDTLADHIRDAHDNLKAGITKIRQRPGFNYLTDIPDEFNKAAHALSYAVKAVEAQSSVDHQQRRGVAWDIIDEAIVAYDQWMLDDDYQFREILAKIMERLIERRNQYASITNSPAPDLASHNSGEREPSVMPVPGAGGTVDSQAADAKAEPLREALERIVAINPNYPIGDPPDPQYFIRTAQNIAGSALCLAPPAVDRAAVIEALKTAALFLEVGAKYVPDITVSDQNKATNEWLKTRGLSTTMKKVAEDCRALADAKEWLTHEEMFASSPPNKPQEGTT
jgi:hypothetical protein